MFKQMMIILLVCTLLAGCATLPAATAGTPSAINTEDASAPHTGTPQATSATPETNILDPKADLSGGAAVIYQRSGGISGLDELWTIYPDGRVSLMVHPQGEGPERDYQSSAAEVAALVSRLDELGFFDLTGSYMPLDTCCDRITYDIKARSGEQVNWVVTLDAAPDVPPELWQAIDAINAFVAQFEK